MRTVTDHVTNPVNDKLNINVIDEPGAGGANHRYDITGMNLKENPSYEEMLDDPGLITILFQNGPIGEAGLNGITQEVLIAIVIDRLRSFQAGPFSCRENAVALTHFETGLLWLQKRTLDRMRRGVEGTSKP